MRKSFVFFSLALLLTLAVSFAAPKPVSAQSGYLFKPPGLTASIRFGTAGPSAQDELFRFFTEELTLERDDFRTFSVAADFGFRVAPKLDIVAGIAFDQSSNRSEFRDWVDQDDQPIEQTTELSRMPVTISARYYLTERGRAIGKHAWVPSRLAPYITLGGGIMFYDLVQQGDFVDWETLDVFSRRFWSDNVAATVHVGGGSELWLTSRFGLTVDGRYAWGSANLDRDFSDFGSIDLRGFQVTTGLTVRF